MTAFGMRTLSAGTWVIDPARSSVTFAVRYLLVGALHGKFEDFCGVIIIADDGTASFTTEIGVNSIDTGNKQRDAHLTSVHFFDAAQFPTATFVSTAVRANTYGYVLEGDFTLKGVAKPIAITLQFTDVNTGMRNGDIVRAEASVVLNRKEFGIGADMPLDGGRAMVAENVTIKLEVEAVKRA